jgi:Uma2 family endonuclease
MHPGYDRCIVQRAIAMIQAKTRFKNIEEYAALTTSDLPECRFELVDGEIVEMGAEADQNLEIAELLAYIFAQSLPYYLIRRGAEIEVDSKTVSSRVPDLIVLTEPTRKAMQQGKRSIITLSMPNPALVVEIVSPGEEGSLNYQRDYTQKPREYAARGIPEYWRIDPERQVVAVLFLDGDAYQVSEFRGSNLVVSPTFPEFHLTVRQILNAEQ